MSADRFTVTMAGEYSFADRCLPCTFPIASQGAEDPDSWMLLYFPLCACSFQVAVDGSGSHEHPQLSAATAQQTRLAVRILNTEDIDELVRRLGVVEAGSSDMHQQTIQNFINRNQVCGLQSGLVWTRILLVR